MKPINTAICLAIAALPLCAAADPQVTLSTLEPPQQEDSLLVRAAKMANHGPMKSTWVITNENLLRYGGHIAIASEPVAKLPAGSSAPMPQPQPAPQQQTQSRQPPPPVALPTQPNNAKPGPQALPQMPITSGLIVAPVQPLKPPQ